MAPSEAKVPLSTQELLVATLAVPSGSSSHPIDHDTMRTARITGLLYLGFFITGVLGSIVVRGQMFAADDPEKTLSNLTNHEGLARVGIALELAIVSIQALTALWFFRLFRSVDNFAAVSLVAFGMVNAVAILGSAAMLATALEASTDALLSASGDSGVTVQLLYVVSDGLWGVSALFFGLWLFPMGWLVLRSNWMPKLLGWLLLVGGAGYTLSPFVKYLFSGAEPIAEALTLPSVASEVWIMGYLIIIGVDRKVPQGKPSGS
ncbi:MAG TPA: DUF4386 domain-containing protein [Tepidiformaceae bacterium]|nr:DUF4386 domain-containing protein [Tepidiformaceae bacterium]HNO66349.1 DUF4386 domain-containing protein [Tepidiformaceae bacterium]